MIKKAPKPAALTVSSIMSASNNCNAKTKSMHKVHNKNESNEASKELVTPNDVVSASMSGEVPYFDSYNEDDDIFEGNSHTLDDSELM